MTALRTLLAGYLAAIPSPFLRGFARGLLCGCVLAAGYLAAMIAVGVLERVGWIG